MKIIEGFNIEDKECQLELLQDDEPGLENIGAEQYCRHARQEKDKQ